MSRLTELPRRARMAGSLFGAGLEVEFAASTKRLKFGVWRYMFATDSDIKQAAGSWNALLTSTKPE